MFAKKKKKYIFAENLMIFPTEKISLLFYIYSLNDFSRFPQMCMGIQTLSYHSMKLRGGSVSMEAFNMGMYG